LVAEEGGVLADALRGHGDLERKEGEREGGREGELLDLDAAIEGEREGGREGGKEGRNTRTAIKLLNIC
jgi:hypothetical protein